MCRITSFWVIAFLMVIECTGQCAFNTLSLMLGTNRYTGLTAGGLNVTGDNCFTQGTVLEGSECAFSEEGYLNSVVARCSAGGIFTYSPANATMMPTECGANPGTATPNAVHYFGETQSYSCPQATTCSQYPCESTCSSGAPNTPLYCYSNCQLGTPTGIIISTITPGPEGDNCSASSIPVGGYSPVCGLAESPGYSCSSFPATVACSAPQASDLITATCAENICNPLPTIPIAGVIGYSGNGDQCPDSNIVLSVISDNSCDVICDQAAGYQYQVGTYSCGSSQNLGVQDLVSTITTCDQVPCPPNSFSVRLGQCSCVNGYTGTVTYNGTAFVGSCVPVACSPFVFPAYAVPGDVNGCLPNEILTSERSQCTLKCGAGYVESSSIVTCDYNNTLLSQTSLQCVEKVCSPYGGFGVGIAASVGGCVVGVQLNAVTNPTCSLTCLSGYSGVDGVLECIQNAPANSPPVEKISCTENACVPPGITFPGHKFSGLPDTCNTVSGCGTVRCQDGFDGEPILTCPLPGGLFSISDPCVAVPCPVNASPLGTCTCDNGYRVEGGGTVSFNATSSNWDHECEATCSHPSFPGCDSSVGYYLIDQPDSVPCSGVSGNPAIDCDTATCCRQTCLGHTCPSGYTLQPSEQCDQGGCTDNVCCFANCANPLYTTCQQSGFSLYPNAESIVCSNNSVSSCDSNSCCISSSCSSVVCVDGTHSITPSPACVNCTPSVCCEENACQQLTSGQLPEYIVEGGSTCTTVSQCGTLMCAAGYRADSLQLQLLCSSHFGQFTATGCIENTCLPTPLTGYKLVNPQCTSVSSCGLIQCEAGYTSDGTPTTLYCPTQGGPMYASGCRENVCKPQDLSKIQIFETAINNCTTPSKCGQITCARGYSPSGTPAITCPVEGGDFSITGCTSNTCLSPLILAGSGYSVSTPSCTRAEQCGTVSCDDGFYQSSGVTPMLVCPFANGEFEVFGCVGPTQAPPTALPTEAPFTPVPPPPGVTVSPEAHCGVCPDRTTCRFITLSVNAYMCVTSCEGMNCNPQQECTAGSTGYSVCVDKVVTPRPTPKPTPRPPADPPLVTLSPTLIQTETPLPSVNRSSTNPETGDETNLTPVIILLVCLLAVVVTLVVVKLLCFSQKPSSRLGEFLKDVDPEISFTDDQQQTELTPNFRNQP